MLKKLLFMFLCLVLASLAMTPAVMANGPDSDGDGVPDDVDNCPDLPGPPENCGCPITGNVDIAFAVDSSGSMTDEMDSLCGVIADIVTALEAQGYTVNYKAMTIHPSYQYRLTCNTGNVRDYINGLGYGAVATVNQYEDWGPATVDLSNYYPWIAGYTRVVIPISDECPQNGNGCDGADTAVITDAIDGQRQQRNGIPDNR